MTEKYEEYVEVAKKIVDLAQAGQGCSMLEEINKLSYADITKAFNAAQGLEDSRIQKMTEPKFPLVTFKNSAKNDAGFVDVDVELLDPSRDSLRTHIFHDTNTFLSKEQVQCQDLKPRK